MYVCVCLCQCLYLRGVCRRDTVVAVREEGGRSYECSCLWVVISLVVFVVGVWRQFAFRAVCVVLEHAMVATNYPAPKQNLKN